MFSLKYYLYCITMVLLTPKTEPYTTNDVSVCLFSVSVLFAAAAEWASGGGLRTRAGGYARGHTGRSCSTLRAGCVTTGPWSFRLPSFTTSGS